MGRSRRPSAGLAKVCPSWNGWGRSLGINIEMYRVTEEWLVATDSDVHGGLVRTPVRSEAWLTLEPGWQMLHALLDGPDGLASSVGGGEPTPTDPRMPPVLALPPAAVERLADRLRLVSFEELLSEHRTEVEAAFGGDCSTIEDDLRQDLQSLRSYYSAAASAGEWVISVME